MELLYKHNKKNLIIFFMIIAIAFENFTIIQIFNAPIKLTHIVFIIGIIGSIYLRAVKKSFSLIQIMAISFFITIPIIPLYRIADTNEFLKTYVVYLIMLFFIVFAYTDLSKKFRLNYNLYIYLFLYIVVFIQILGVIQFISMNYFGYFFLEGIWGQYQFHTSIFGMQFGLYRAYSIFHEPSVFGWITTTSFAICEYLRKNLYLSTSKYLFLQLFNIIAVVVSLSASALIILLFVFGISILLEIKKPAKFFSLITLSVVFTFILWKYTVLFNSLDRVGNEINTSNSSGYERLNTPWQYLVSTIQEYPIFGRGLGQEGNIDAVGIIGLYEGVNNSLFGIFVNFGLSALFFITILLFYFFKKSRNSRDYLLLVSALFGMYISTGAYLSLDTFVILIFVLFIGDLPKISRN